MKRKLEAKEIAFRTYRNGLYCYVLWELGSDGKYIVLTEEEGEEKENE